MSRRESASSDSSKSVQLPPELWIAVLTQIHPNPGSTERRHVIARLDINENKSQGDEVLQNVSLTCRPLHDLALPIRFKYMELHAEEAENTKPTELFTRLSKSETLRNFVKVISVWIYGRGLPSLPDSAQGILRGMHNLEDMRMMTPFQMTTRLYSHICSLHSLHRLEATIPLQEGLDRNDIAPITPDHFSINSLFIKYSEMVFGYQRISDNGWPPQDPWAIPPAWLALMALAPSIRHLILPVHAITLPSIGLTSRTIARPSPHLITLEVAVPGTVPEWEEFWKVVGLSPLITTLVFIDGFEFRDATALHLPLPSQLLPALRRFEGSIGHAKLIVPGRPVHTLVLTSPFRVVDGDQLRPLTRSTATVRSVDIHDPSSLDLVAMVAEVFSDLERFHMQVVFHSPHSKEWLRKSFASHLGRFQRLRSLGLCFRSKMTVNEEMDALSCLPDNHPLESARFARCPHRQGCTCSDGLWQKRSGVWMKS